MAGRLQRGPPTFCAGVAGASRLPGHVCAAAGSPVAPGRGLHDRSRLNHQRKGAPQPPGRNHRWIELGGNVTLQPARPPQAKRPESSATMPANVYATYKQRCAGLYSAPAPPHRMRSSKVSIGPPRDEFDEIQSSARAQTHLQRVSRRVDDSGQEPHLHAPAGSPAKFLCRRDIPLNQVENFHPSSRPASQYRDCKSSPIKRRTG